MGSKVGGGAVHLGPDATAEGEGAAADGNPGTAEEGASAVHPSESSVAGFAAALGTDAGSMSGTSSGFGHRAATGSASGAASSPWPEGMDPDSSFCLKIRLIGNPKKSRFKCFCFEMVVDSDLTNYTDLVASIVEQYPPRYLEVAHLQYYDEVLNTFPEIKSDQELMAMFEKHLQTKFVEMFVAYCHPSEAYEPITEYYTDVHDQPNNKASQDEDSYLRNPIPENEHVGIDEENMYSEKEPISLNVVLFSDKEKEPEDGSVHASGDESEDESEVEEDEEVQEPNHAPTVEYDKEDPPMTVGSRYPNMDVPCDDGGPTRMCFPPCLSLETTTKKKGKASKRKSLEGTSSNKEKKAKCSGGSKRSEAGSNQLVPLSIEASMPNEQADVPVKVRAKQKKKEQITKIPMVPFDSPAMGTRSKRLNPPSPAMSTRSKRRLSL